MAFGREVPYCRQSDNGRTPRAIVSRVAKWLKKEGDAIKTGGFIFHCRLVGLDLGDHVEDTGGRNPQDCREVYAFMPMSTRSTIASERPR